MPWEWGFARPLLISLDGTCGPADLATCNDGAASRRDLEVGCGCGASPGWLTLAAVLLLLLRRSSYA